MFNSLPLCHMQILLTLSVSMVQLSWRFLNLQQLPLMKVGRGSQDHFCKCQVRSEVNIDLIAIKRMRFMVIVISSKLNLCRLKFYQQIFHDVTLFIFSFILSISPLFFKQFHYIHIHSTMKSDQICSVRVQFEYDNVCSEKQGSLPQLKRKTWILYTFITVIYSLRCPTRGKT